MTGKSMKRRSKYKVLALMSGTSLDGLDLAYCEFVKKGQRWQFNTHASQTVMYSSGWHRKLSTAHQLSGEKLLQLDLEYGTYLGEACKNFIKRKAISEIDFVASHGHTVFHQPKRKFTFQLGDGVALCKASGLPVICDFRSLDVLKGGQGAPLVPVGDHFLFSTFDICLNIGGIANLSMVHNDKRIAFDICFANMGLNHLSRKLGKKFDRGGKMAALGSVDRSMLNRLDKIYKSRFGTKPSLGREGFEKHILPLLDDKKLKAEDRIRTFVESIADQIAAAVGSQTGKVRMIATGGGALNTFLIQTIQNKLSKQAALVVPDQSIINYKEAIIFGFLGVLRFRNEINILKSVTGASSDSCSGTMIGFLN